MGLDAWLFREREVEQGITEKVELSYYRKFNALHNHFIENFSDDPESSSVVIELDDLKDLLSKVTTSLNSKTPSLTPVSGFFFGSTAIDDYYWSDCKQLVKDLDNIISSHKQGDKYTYENWW